MNKNTDVATVEPKENGISVFDIDNFTTFPDLDNANVYPFDLMADYWTPESPGEIKNVLFDKLAMRSVVDQQTNEPIDLECAYFFEEVNGEIKSVSNGSKRLVGAIEANKIHRGTPLRITYMGKKRNKSNSFHSDNWSVKVLRLNID
jgi:hypothetical protein